MKRFAAALLLAAGLFVTSMMAVHADPNCQPRQGQRMIYPNAVPGAYQQNPYVYQQNAYGYQQNPYGYQQYPYQQNAYGSPSFPYQQNAYGSPSYPYQQNAYGSPSYPYNGYYQNGYDARFTPANGGANANYYYGSDKERRDAERILRDAQKRYGN